MPDILKITFLVLRVIRIQYRKFRKADIYKEKNLMRLVYHPEITGQPWCISFPCKVFLILLVSDLFWFMDSGALLIPQGIVIVPLKMFHSVNFIYFVFYL